MHQPAATRAPRTGAARNANVVTLVAAALGLAALTGLAGCSSAPIEFRYPGEQIDFSLMATDTARIFVDVVRDLRTGEQRRGDRGILTSRYPGDDDWARPVVQIYRNALVQDLTQTRLVEVVPLMGQADYLLSVDIISLGGKVRRNPLNFLLPLMAGLGVGFAVGDDTSDGLKTGAALGVATLIAVPTPTAHRAECEVRMELRDRSGELIWRRACLGLVDDDVWITATSSDVEGLTNRYVAAAIKRCNGCLLGQLRQALGAEGF